jgi:membrane fusion protein (multidrug efflux system)
MFLHEHLDEGINERGLLVPQQAVTHNQRGEATTVVVSPDNKVSTRVIKTERAIGDQWLVSEGLAAGDKVVVSGLQRITSGVVEVKTKEVLLAQLNSEQIASARPASVEALANSESLRKQ